MSLQTIIFQVSFVAHGFPEINYTQVIEILMCLMLENSNVKTIERFSDYHFQELWNNLCNNDLPISTQLNKSSLTKSKGAFVIKHNFVKTHYVKNVDKYIFILSLVLLRI